MRPRVQHMVSCTSTPGINAMPKALRQKDKDLLELLHARVLFTLEFLERVHDFPSAIKWRKVTEKAYAEHNLRSMRMINHEIDSMTAVLTGDQREGLEALLSARLGVNKDEERDEQRRQISRILQRGTIASERERRRLEQYLEQLEATGDSGEDLTAIRHLLSSS